MLQHFGPSNGNRRVQPPLRHVSTLQRTGSWRLRYLFAVAATSASAGAIAAVDLTLSFPLFVLFVAAVGLTWLFAGLGPAVCALVMSTLASDFLVIEPRYELSLNGTVLRLAAVHSAGALVSRAVPARVAAGTHAR
jgi:two-component system sensor histidine kinase KdpD